MLTKSSSQGKNAGNIAVWQARLPFALVYLGSPHSADKGWGCSVASLFQRSQRPDGRHAAGCGRYPKSWYSQPDGGSRIELSAAGNLQRHGERNHGYKTGAGPAAQRAQSARPANAGSRIGATPDERHGLWDA